MPGDLVISDPAVKAAPKDYTVAGAQTFVILAVKASFDGSGASTAFVPALELLTPAGQSQAKVPVSLPVQGGGSADVTFAPGLGSEQAVATTSTLLVVNVSANGVTTLVSGTANRRIRVVQVALMSAGTTAWTFRSNATDLAGPYNLAAATGFVLGDSPTGFWFQTAVGEDLRVNNALAIQVAGVLAYVVV